MASEQGIKSAFDTRLMLRLVAGFGAGLVITATLFWFMEYLITSADNTLDRTPRGALVDFVRVEREEVVERRQVKPKKPPAPDTPPPQPPTPRLDPLRASPAKLAMQSVPVSTDIELSSGGFSLGVGGGEYLPIVKVAPIYPQRALNRGVEGECIVEFTVSGSGTTRDAHAVAGQCHSAFKKASVDAALKFKYKPRIVDGKAVEVPGVRNKFTYRLEQ